MNSSLHRNGSFGLCLLCLCLVLTWAAMAPESRADEMAPVAVLTGGADAGALEGVRTGVFVPSAGGVEPSLATIGADNIVHLWGWRDGKLLRSLPGLEGSAGQLIASPDGKTLAASWSSGEGKTFAAGVRVWSLPDGQSKTLPAPDAGFTRLAFWPDAKTLAVQGQQKTRASTKTVISLYDVASGALQRTLANHYPFAFDARSGALLEGHTNPRASGNVSSIARWTLSTGDLEAALWPLTDPRGGGGIASGFGEAALSPDSARVAVLGNEQIGVSHVLRMFGMAPLRSLWMLTPPGGESQSAFYSVNFAGRLLLTQSGFEGLTVWDGQSGDLLATLPAITGLLSVSPDGRFLAAWPRPVRAGAAGANAPSQVQIWDLSGLKPLGEGGGAPLVAGADGALFIARPNINLGKPNNNPGMASALAVSPDGKMVVTAQGDYLVGFDAATGARLHTHSGTGGSVSLAVSPDGRFVLTGSGSDDTARLWDGHTLSLLRLLGRHEWGINAVAFSPDGRLAVAGGSGLTGATGRASVGLISVWETATGKKLKWLVNSSDRVQSLAFSPDGKLLANGNFQQGIDLWSVDKFLADPDPFGGKPDRTLQANGTGHKALAFSKDGKTLFAATPDGQIEVFDIPAGKLLRGWQTGDEARLRALALSPDGKHLASVAGPDIYPKPRSPDGVVKIWDARTGKLLRTLQTPGVSTSGVAFQTAAAGETLAVGLADGSVKLWPMKGLVQP